MEHRVVYVAMVGRRFLLLHAFTKKTVRRFDRSMHFGAR